MTGVESGNMLTPSALISTDTEDGQASEKEKKKNWQLSFSLIKLKNI